MARKKRKLSPKQARIFKAWRDCWQEEGICPTWGKVSPSDKGRVRACVNRKLR